MGFGLLLCGYFIATMMSLGMGAYSFAAYLLGGMICYTAASKLKAYNPRFLLTMVVSVALVLLGIYQGALLIDNIFVWGIMPTGNVSRLVEEGVILLINLALHATVLWSVIELTAHLEMENLKSRAIRNAVFMGIYGIGEAVVIAVPAVANLENQAIPRLLLLYLLVCYILNAWLLYGCYQGICPAGEEMGTPRKPSRFAFINKLNDKFDERAQRALREDMEYQAQKQTERANKKKRKKKK